MFNLDKWQEIIFTVQKNKLRTFLTAFSTAWGIFILVVLLGAGSGLKNGIDEKFRDDATNSIWVRAGQTSIPYKGMKPGKNLQLINEDHNKIKDTISGVEHITSRFYLSGEYTIRYKNEYSLFGIRATHPGHKFVEKTIITKGRFINDLDIKGKRKVAAIGLNVVERLFKNEDPIGEWINVNGIQYKVVGVYKDLGREWEMSWIYIPVTTAQMAYNGANRVSEIIYTTGNAKLDISQAMADQTKAQLVERLKFSPDDPRAMTITNFNEEFQRFMDMMTGIKLFIWIVGIGTIAAGVVGVSNVMMVVIKERTREIGIRKAIGATPGSIVNLVILESIMITIIAGYLGLVAGVVFVESVSWSMENLGFQNDYFKNPDVEFKTAIAATIVLILAGTLAGVFPARIAANIKPVEALREE